MSTPMFSRRRAAVARLAGLLIAAAALPIVAHAQVSVSTLHPPPKSSFPRSSDFRFADSVVLVAPQAPADDVANAVAWLEHRLSVELAVRVIRVTPAAYDGSPAIVVGVFGDPGLDARLRTALVPIEWVPLAGGYVLDISSAGVLLGGGNAEGIFNGISTLLQLGTPTGMGGRFAGAHVHDYPDFPNRWVFNMANLRGPGQLVALRGILDTMAALKLNGIQQNDFKYSLLGSQPGYYFDSVRAFRTYSTDRGIGITPGVAPIGYSEGLLWHDPNLAEGPMARTRYVIEADTGRLVPTPAVTLPNGTFESVDANNRFTGWSFYDDQSIVVDRTVRHSGAIAARGENFSGPNCRFSRRIDTRPNACYRLSAWVRTENLNADMLQLLALGVDSGGTYRPLTFTQFSVPATSDWRQIQVVFNTLKSSTIQVYVGLWGARSGKVWFDDFAIEEVGLVNVLRRDGTPLHVRHARTGTEYREGADFAPVRDPQLGGGGGSYPWHQGPTFRRTTTGGLRNGDTVEISWFHPITTLADERGYGQNMVCLSDDTLGVLLEDQVRRLDSLYNPDSWLMQHDEIRVMNLDSACLRRSMSPAALLADNAWGMYRTIGTVHPKPSDVYVWSDMFDSLHNATASYYLVNGDLRGVWNLIPKEIIMVNWAGFAMNASLAKFSSLGFRQIAAPYYDERATDNIRAWRIALEGLGGARGMMYTTWVADYSFLRPFAYYVWGAGPTIIHTPRDTSVFSRLDRDTLVLQATVRPDPYDSRDSIIGVTATVMTFGGGMPAEETVQLRRTSGNEWSGVVESIGWQDFFRYSLTARNAQGIARRTPDYQVSNPAGAVRPEARALRPGSLAIVPNPASGAVNVGFEILERSRWRLRILDNVGRVISERKGVDDGGVRVAVDATQLASGAYRCVVTVGGSQLVQGFSVVR